MSAEKFLAGKGNEWFSHRIVEIFAFAAEPAVSLCKEFAAVLGVGVGPHGVDFGLFGLRVICVKQRFEPTQRLVGFSLH